MLLQHHGLPVIVALNRFGSDTERELEMIGKRSGEQASKPSSASTSRKARSARRILPSRWSSSSTRSPVRPRRRRAVWKKIGKVAKKIYHASEVVADTAVRKKIEK
jgi:formate--tetrahydrofolate ligase